MSQTADDMSDKFIAGAIAITKVKGSWGGVKQKVGPTAGPQAEAAWEAEGEKRAQKAREKPPFFTPNVTPELLSRVIITRLAGPLGMDPKKVRVIAEEGYEEKGSPAGFAENTIYINPGKVDPSTGAGREVIVHEAVHFAQSKNQGKKDLASAEAEAAQIARADAYNQPIAPPAQGLPATETAAFQPFGAGPPDQVILNLNGALVEVPTPGTVEKEITVPVPGSPVPGLTLNSVDLKFDEGWNITEGLLYGAVQTPFVTAANVRLIVKTGGAVQMDIPTADLKVGDVAYGTMDLVVTPEGVTGDAKVEFGNVTLGLGLEISEGYVELHHTPDQQIKGLGKLAGQAEGLGPFEMALVLENTEPTGRISVSTAAPVDLGPGVVMPTATVSADFEKQGFVLKGGAKVQVGDWAVGDLAAEYKYPGGPWSAAGTLNQTGGERSFGDLTVSSATLGVTVAQGSLQEIKGQGHFVVPHFQGNFGGSYDVGADAFTADGTVQMTEEIDFGEGVILKAVDGTLKMEMNKLTESEAKMTAEFPYEGEPSFLADFEGKYLFPEEKFSGQGKLRTIRDIRFGPETAYNVTVTEGSEAEVTVTDNLIEKAGAMWDYIVKDADGEIGTGSGELKYDGKTFSGGGKFTLTTDLGYPDRQMGPVQLLTGTTAEVKFENSLITSIKISNGGIHVKSESGQGEIDGTFEGEVHPDEMVVVSAKGMATQQSPVKLLNDMIEVTAEGVNIVIENDVLMESSGSVSMAVNAVGGLEGSADFKWDKQSGADQYDFDGIIKYVITEEIQGEIDVLYEGGTFSIEGTPVDTVEKLDELAELVRRVLDVASVGAAVAPFSLELIPAYLAYRIWVLKDLSASEIGQALKDVWAQIQGGFAWLLEFLPEWMKQAWSWVESGSPNVLHDMAEWLSENLQALGQVAVDWLGDMGEWGANVIRGGGAWAVEAAGWAMESISDAGEAIGAAAEAAWDWLS